MGQFFTDDVEALLRAGHGDHDRLMRIKSDFETKKLVTIDDRKYVEGLVSRYIQPEPERIVKLPEKRIVPPPPPPKESFELKYQQQPKQVEQIIPKLESKTKIRNVVIAVAAVVFAVLLVSIVAMNQDKIDGIGGPTIGKNLETDQIAYLRGDVISISGKAPTSGIVKLVISNPENQEIWSEIVTAKTNGEFSTLVIAGGTGWEQVGKYTLSSTQSGTTEQVTFDFNPNESS
jgi:hypothetical protein